MEGPRDDPQYLKDYIKEHPTNKMAWYLLGRQYAAKGEQGKANYCFAQAGEVYHAFEKGEPLGQPDEEQQRQQEEESSAAKPQARKWKAAVVILLLLLSGYIPFQPDRTEGSKVEAAAGPFGNGTTVGSSTANDDLSGLSGGLDVVYSKPSAGGANRTSEIGELLSRFQDKSLSRSDVLLLAEPKWSIANKWLLWPSAVKPIVSVEHSGTAAGTRLTYYDAKTCLCEPADAAAISNQYVQWQSSQLQQLIVRSAIASYEEVTGKAPQTIEQMARNYPDNWIAGYTPVMKRYFDMYTAERRVGSQAASDNSQSAFAPSGAGASTDQSLMSASEALQQPLRILIDKTTHTLALVSGSVLIRSYPVGLGGALTPEGEFTITEKVRNPNGRDNGTFGSRGMTLSDTLYAIHGTNQPSSIGKDKSLGCIRMLKPDVEELFDMVPKGTKVVIGQNLSIPMEQYRSDTPLRVPSQTDETNLNKKYNWLG